MMHQPQQQQQHQKITISDGSWYGAMDVEEIGVAWNVVPGYMNWLDESMSIWTGKFTCPGLMFVAHEPWPFGNEYHTICCCTSGIMRGIDLVEGKDHPRALGQQEFDNMGSTFGLLLQMLAPIFHKGYVVILGSGFCSGIQRWFTTISCTAMLWMTTMESDTHESA